MDDPNRLFGDRAAGNLVADPAPDAADTSAAQTRPLAARMRPQTAADLAGHEGLLAHGSPLYEAIENGQPPSMIFYGPPGTGKTTIARIVARASQAAFEENSAVLAGRQDVRDVIARATERRRTVGRATVYFLDEIHRFNKAQQDTLLPAVEEGVLTLIGATTQNPSFEVNSALLSRCRLVEFKALEESAIVTILLRALATDEKLRTREVAVGEETLAFIADRCDGDARVALNALEMIVRIAEHEKVPAGVGVAEQAMQQKALLYDARGDAHYDYISAYIKSMRGSDADAAIYYLAVMLAAGEDPRFIARRLVIAASEDVGNADPCALGTAVAAAHAVELVGMPECRIALSQATAYVALAPKSRAACRAIDDALDDIARNGAKAPPVHLRHRSRNDAAERRDLDAVTMNR